MSARDARAYLHDIIGACDGIRDIIGLRDGDAYRSNLTMRLATERELITIGEAVGRLAQMAPGLILDWTIPARPIVGLRNLLVHGYFAVDDDRVYEIAIEQVPLLRLDACRALQTLEDER